MESSTKVYNKLLPIAQKTGASIAFQPKETKNPKYPAIQINYSYPDTTRADNIAYMTKMFFDIMVITQLPDTKIVKQILNLPNMTLDRVFENDNLYHYVISTYEIL